MCSLRECYFSLSSLFRGIKYLNVKVVSPVPSPVLIQQVLNKLRHDTADVNSTRTYVVAVGGSPFSIMLSSSASKVSVNGDTFRCH